MAHQIETMLGRGGGGVGLPALHKQNARPRPFLLGAGQAIQHKLELVFGCGLPPCRRRTLPPLGQAVPAPIARPDGRLPIPILLYHLPQQNQPVEIQDSGVYRAVERVAVEAVGLARHDIERVLCARFVEQLQIAPVGHVLRPHLHRGGEGR